MTGLKAPDDRHRAPVAAGQWHAGLAEPSLRGTLGLDPPLVLLRFRGIGASITQPALAETVLAIHLGGPKRITRAQGRSRRVFDVDENALTIMPALQAYQWRTEGPVDFAHITLTQDFLARIAIEEFDRAPDRLRLRPVVGAGDALASALCHALLAECAAPAAGRLYRESLLVALGCHLARRFSDPSIPWTRPAPAKGGLAGWQLARVTEHMQSRLAEDFDLSVLVALTGLSRAQFFRAFNRSLGRSPYAHLTDLRVRRATELLAGTRLPVGAVAASVGLPLAQLGVAFRKRRGVSPTAYRRDLGRAA